jgi:hypothetical protein
MRGHYYQIALLLFGCVNDGFPGMIIAFTDSFDLHPGCLCELFDVPAFSIQVAATFLARCENTFGWWPVGNAGWRN